MRHVAGCPAEWPPHTDEHAFGVAAPVSRRSLVAGLGAAFLLPAGAARAAAPSHGPFTDLLQRYVVAGRDGLNRVRYARFKAEAGGSLDRYIASLAATRVSGLGRDDAFAFWVNLYNAVTLQVVLAHYPRPLDSRDRPWRGLFRPRPLAQEPGCRRGARPVARRHRARDPAQALVGAARSLCRQLRLHRLPQPCPGGLVGRDARADAGRGRPRLHQSPARRRGDGGRRAGLAHLQLVFRGFRNRGTTARTLACPCRGRASSRARCQSANRRI